ncbi:hypothetical protein ACH5RR_018632 [Cinchona calisaya]|uniref:Uncharacterized protein n=1 Tax=Cinchona calisaya TaxID=153742 RepID=A0ABD2ZMH3_9GENT
MVKSSLLRMNKNMEGQFEETNKKLESLISNVDGGFNALVSILCQEKCEDSAIVDKVTPLLSNQQSRNKDEMDYGDVKQGLRPKEHGILGS